MKVSPSILATNLANISLELEKIDLSITDYIHMDVMDGHFVPPVTFGEAYTTYVAEILKQKNATSLLDVHLMVDQPEKEVPKYFSIQPAIITFHIETTEFPIRLASEIRKKGILAGISLNPATPLSQIENILPYIDLVLLMSVEPGYYGQPFIETTWEKIDLFNEMREKHPNLLLQIDGGVDAKNAERLAEKKVNIVVAGSFVFKNENPNKQIKYLKDL